MSDKIQTPHRAKIMPYVGTASHSFANTVSCGAVSWVLGECLVSECSCWVEWESSKEAAGAGAQGLGGGVHRHSRETAGRLGQEPREAQSQIQWSPECHGPRAWPLYRLDSAEGQQEVREPELGSWEGRWGKGRAATSVSSS